MQKRLIQTLRGIVHHIFLETDKLACEVSTLRCKKSFQNIDSQFETHAAATQYFMFSSKSDHSRRRSRTKNMLQPCLSNFRTWTQPKKMYDSSTSKDSVFGSTEGLKSKTTTSLRICTWVSVKPLNALMCISFHLQKEFAIKFLSNLMLKVHCWWKSECLQWDI